MLNQLTLSPWVLIMITGIGLEKSCFVITDVKHKLPVFICSVSSLLVSNSTQCVIVVILEAEIFGQARLFDFFSLLRLSFSFDLIRRL